MDGKVDLITIVALLIALFVILRLRSVLGKRNGDEAARYERYKAQEAARETARASAASGNEKVVTLPRKDKALTPTQAAPNAELDTTQEQRMTKFAGGNPAVARGLIEIAKADTSFDPDGFLKGAKAAYEMIVMAFAEGDRKTLKNLLSPDVYAGFDAAIADREGRKEKVEQTFVGISGAEVADAHMRDGAAQLTVHFISDLISVTKDSAGQVVAGDDRRIKQVNDVWSFSRALNASGPNWFLIATQPVDA
jgi:predicted lipid-binding transport protein (Tim44 family)